MGLARAWRRRLYASVALTVIVPAALLVTLALLAVGGGSFSLVSLGQAVSGPSAPTVTPVALGAGSGSSSARPSSRSQGGPPAGVTLLAAVPAPVGHAQAPRVAAPSTHRGGSGRGGLGGRGGGGSPGGGSPGGGGGGSGGGSPHRRPPTHHTIVDRIVDTVTPVTSSLPGPAGPILTQVVKSVGSVGDQLLKHLPK
jgi:hypothetical protein